MDEVWEDLSTGASCLLSWGALRKFPGVQELCHTLATHELHNSAAPGSGGTEQYRHSLLFHGRAEREGMFLREIHFAVDLQDKPLNFAQNAGTLYQAERQGL